MTRIKNLINRQWTLRARPIEKVELSHFKYREIPVEAPKRGEMLVKTHYLNLAPVMRMYMMEGGGGYSTERILELGDVIHGRGVAEVIASEHPSYEVGDFVHGQIGWQTYKVTAAAKQEKFTKMTPHKIPIYYGLSALGMTGYSAYTGFIGRGQAKKGETIVVSGAAGGVGSLVVQIAKAIGCTKVVGIAGGKEKCDIVRSLGADEMIDYKNEDVAKRLPQLLPNGFDVYFDNVGGEILEACLDNLGLRARVVLCGAISEYARKDPFSFKNYGNLRMKDADLRGFFVYNNADMFQQAELDIAKWIKTKQLKALMDIDDGFDKVPDALIGLYKGENIGKRIVKVSEGPEIIY